MVYTNHKFIQNSLIIIAGFFKKKYDPIDLTSS